MENKVLFISLYRALDCLYDEEPNDELGNFLSGMNPYLFKDGESADPAIYAEFEEYMNNRQISLDEATEDDGYEVAYNYLKDCTKFSNWLKKISIEEWKDVVKIVKKEIE